MSARVVTAGKATQVLVAGNLRGAMNASDPGLAWRPSLLDGSGEP
jgi:hypothetical protein